MKIKICIYFLEITSDFRTNPWDKSKFNFIVIKIAGIIENIKILSDR